MVIRARHAAACISDGAKEGLFGDVGRESNNSVGATTLHHDGAHHVRYRMASASRACWERRRGLEEANPGHLVVEREKRRVIL